MSLGLTLRAPALFVRRDLAALSRGRLVFLLRSLVAGVAALLAGSFAAYFALLVYCDIFRPVNPGFEADPSPAGPLVVTRVTEGSPAARGGLAVGDRLISINSVTIADSDSWGALGGAYEVNGWLINAGLGYVFEGTNKNPGVNGDGSDCNPTGASISCNPVHGPNDRQGADPTSPLLTPIYQDNYPDATRGRFFSRTFMIRILSAAVFSFGGGLPYSRAFHFGSQMRRRR